ncbi:riboflavin synthase [Wolbachia endosymbiont of Ctenocephalides felis wCfeJ]|uniref:riboflavin synthase n=1 Tax=Wolbachia endosymbiont of Ctenocephalides felis wCfeJ TaxID=2732594 RepID=UPI0014486479|nr:riboflavin synthase [Wolbachia endosymbiont of Ctenocephalides felis wCfeJ]WCR57596.1 MAG: Riboflavin synthase [Wolbachia endosymbiont of Ctenocephalides felis wCfeJ]
MFKGIITNIGTVIDITTGSNSNQIFYIKAQNLLSVHQGDSVACSGVCLTVVDIINDVLKVQVSQETMKVSNLSTWKVGKKMNLEQAMKLSDRIDGHLVQGHVDKTVQILAINQNLDSHEIKLSCPEELIKFIAKKGSVTLDGVSLTINSVTDREFAVNIIPYTWKNTTFQYNKVGDYLNLEVDMVARYLDQLIRHQYN